VAAGESFSLYMKDGLVYFMGSNSYGQAANSSLGATDVLSPALTNFTGNMMMGSGNVFELQSTTFASPSTLSRGSDNTLVLEWEFVGGSNIEILDSITLNIQGDINDIDRFEILDVTSSHVSIYSGNAINGDVVSGNAFFTGSPQTVLADETRQYQLIVSVNESTSQDNIEITLPPENLSLSGGNVAQGNVLTTGVLMFVGSSNGNTMANVQGLSDTSIVMGPAVTYLLDDGVLTTRGRDDFGELARTGDANIFLPTNLTNLISVDVGENHGIALGGNGEVYTWGSNLLSQSNASGQPELVTGLGNAIWVGAGAYNSYVVNEVGQLFSTGRNHKAQSGQGFDSISTTWAMVSLPAGNIEQIEAGIEHVLMIIDGSLYGFGSNGFGQLTIDNASVPTLIDNSQSWVEIAAGGFHSLALSGNGNVYSWGKNHRGQLGLGFESAIENNINHVTGMTNIVELAAGYSHSIFMEEVSNVRSLYTSGSSQFGQNGHVNDTSVPTLLSGEPSVDEVSAGPNSTIFKHSGNIIKMMGRESDGTDHVTPIQIFDTGI
jgi:alpha-tubulin suppressor-like RCC1 family protein